MTKLLIRGSYLRNLIIVTFGGFGLSVGHSVANPPTISTAGTNVVGTSEFGYVFSWNGDGDDPPLPNDETACPPWTPDGEENYIWTVSGNLTVFGPSDQTSITIATDSPGKAKVKFKRKQDNFVDDSSPENNAGPTYSKESPESELIVAKISDQTPDKDWYYYENPVAPYPENVEIKSFEVVKDIPPEGTRYDWTSNPPIVQLIDVGGNYGGSMGMYVRGRSKNIGEVSVMGSWRNNQLGELQYTILSGYFDRKELATPIALGGLLGYGWRQLASYYFVDQFGADIPEGHGVNQDFSERQNANSSVGWPDNQPGGAPMTVPGRVIDTYEAYKYYFSIVTPDPVKPGESGEDEEVFRVKQTIFLGSLAPHTGKYTTEHTLIFHRGHASWQ